MRADIAVFFKLSAVIVLAFTFSYMGLEWAGATTLPETVFPTHDVNLSDFGYGTSSTARMAVV